MPQQMIQQAAHLGFGYGQTNASRHSQTNARMEQMRPHKQMHTLTALVNVIVGMVLESLNTLESQLFSPFIPQNKPLLLIVFFLKIVEDCCL